MNFKGIIILIIIIVFGYSLNVFAENYGEFIIIILDQLSLKEISYLADRELIELFDKSAQALMNVRTDQGIEPRYTYQAFGAGNRGQKYGSVPGIMGQLLSHKDIKAVVYGNTDYGIEKNRDVLSLLMESGGKPEFGDVSREMLVQDGKFPGGWRTDYQRLTELFIEGYKNFDLIIIEIGDISRIKHGIKTGEVDIKNLDLLVKQTLKRFDIFLETVKKVIQKEDQLMLVAPTPDQVSEYGISRLSWVLLSGQERTGLLTTPTTRRLGLVTISDLAPTILNHFQIASPVVVTGRPIYSVHDFQGGLTRLLQLDAQIYRTSVWRPWYIKGFILLQIIVLAMATFTFFVRKQIKGYWWKAITSLILGVTLIPVTFLIFTPHLTPDFCVYLIIFIGIITIATWLILSHIRLPFTHIVSITTLTVSLIIIDIIRKSPWMSSSLLGYCPVIGARFYGIGNEFMGILIGGTLIGWTGLIDHFTWLKNRKMVLTPLVFLGITLLIGYPALGANFGGTMTALSAFSFTYILMFERGKRVKIVLAALVAILLFISIIIVSDTYSWTGERSHLGQTIHLIRNQGVSALINIISRKLSMNIKLLRWTIWTRVLLTFIIVLALIFKRPKGYLQALVQEFPNFALGFAGVILGSIITMMVNDSGVVAAATLLFFGVHPLIYLYLKGSERGRNL